MTSAEPSPELEADESLGWRSRVRRINLAMDYLDTHLNEPLNVDALAQCAHFSRRYFTKVFLDVTGETPGDYQRRIRLERAAFLLYLWRSAPVSAIALTVGFSSAAVFARAFRAQFGRSAQEWRLGDFWHRCGLNACWRPMPCHECETPQGPLSRYARPPEKFDASRRWEIFDAAPDTLSDMQVEVLPTLRIAYMRAQGPYQATILKLIKKMSRWAAVRGLLTSDTMFVSNIRDIPSFTTPRQIRYDAGIVVGPDFVPDRYVNVRDIPGGPHATARFAGPYVEDTLACRYLWNYWIPDNGCIPIGRVGYGIGRVGNYLKSFSFDWNSVVSYSIRIPLRSK